MKFLSIILCLVCTTSVGQTNHGMFIELHILNDSLRIRQDQQRLTLVLRCINHHDRNLLLYGFGGNGDVLKFGVDLVCEMQDRVSGGLGVLIVDERNRRVYAEYIMSDSIHNTPMPLERLESIMKNSRIRYLNKTKVLNASSSLTMEKTIELNNFRLRKGRYYLQVIGFGGDALRTTLVGEEQIEKDRQMFDADLYQGCATSNTITFVVE